MVIDAIVKAQIAQILKEKIKESGLTNTDFCKKNSIPNKAYFDQIVSSNYTESHPKAAYWQNLARIIGIEGAEKYWQHFETSHFENTQSVALRARDEKEAWVLDGGTGYGKSYALEDIYKKSEADVFYFRFFDESLSPIEFAQKLLKLMNVYQIENVSVDSLSLNKCIKHLISKLISLPKSLLIIDEMEYCSPACLKQIRKLIYETKSKAGILLCGCGLNGTLQKLATSKNAEKQGWKQLHSRLKHNIALLERLGPDAKDDIATEKWHKQVREVCKIMGIKEQKVVKYMCENACDFRDLRALVSKGLEASDITEQLLTLDLLYSTINNVLPS